MSSPSAAILFLQATAIRAHMQICTFKSVCHDVNARIFVTRELAEVLMGVSDGALLLPEKRRSALSLAGL
ncbi:hypothetical protein TSAR_000896 [Trichomalopsis sarcophagae]|uniref:Uncharacterized protein n=1 Tax=Trichomalopsis sarcophagae TaxID=543379 RepID=A0A232F8J0_9HYME|nr:hypothetical protein TSAR_000896 [Trichomalopsis sarcophagae]